MSITERSGRSRDPAERGTTVDGQLMLRLADGDPGALGELYDRFAPQVYALARSVCGDAGVAEDITCDLFLEMRRIARRIAPEGGPAPWLLTTAHRRALEALRDPSSPD